MADRDQLAQHRKGIRSGTTGMSSGADLLPLPLSDCVGQVRHALAPLARLSVERLKGHAARVDALEQADAGAE
jgi:hypothetical protein